MTDPACADPTPPARTSPNWWLSAAQVAALAVVVAGAVLTFVGDRSTGIAVWVIGLACSLLARRRGSAASLRAAQEWTLPQVRQVLTEAGAARAGHPEQVLALRRADRRLSLVDAVALVQRAAEPAASPADSPTDSPR
ncbi:hypothetical protein [Kineococcus sp. SYSU DK005]|uniref:hypothetical protein n=1 Tax=Kineococcus sp. SYSU DK005 TaxID=3383126 RepID=UPI003D7C9190